ncbi:MAG TPA: hypothetical protein VFI94_18075 [Pseudolabrys sp.]|nr:hypothetical protein [Pseudolabrys sp.]
MARPVLLAAAFAFAFGAIDANAARTLLKDFMARPPAGADEPAISVLALEACLRRGQELDRTGTAIDYEIAVIDREAAEALLLQKQLNAELPTVQEYDEPALNEFQRRVIRHEELARKFQMEFPLYQNKQKAYDAAVEEFEHVICASRFRRDDLDAARTKLDLK